MICFRNSDQIRDWLEKEYRTPLFLQRREKDLLKRIGDTYPQGDRLAVESRSGQTEGIRPQVREAEGTEHGTLGTGAHAPTRFVDACHPIWGLDLVYSCWLLVGQRFLAGMGSGRKRLNILGALLSG